MVSILNMVSGLLSNWIITDVDLAMLNAHNGPYLKELGAELQELDALQAWKEPFAQSECIVILACLYPAGDMFKEFSRLLRVYNVASENSNIQHHFQAVVMESLEAQMPRSTIIAISRQGDPLIPGQSNTVTCRMRPVLGYAPKRSSRGPGELHELFNARDLHVRMSMQGPLQGQQFVDHSDRFLELHDFVFSAWERDILTIFVGEWDGSLSAGLARALVCRASTHRHISSTMPNGFVLHGPSPSKGKGGWAKGKGKGKGDCEEPLRAFKGYVGPYSGYLEYASEVWCEKMLRHLAAHQHLINNHDMMVGINAAVMWFFARPMNRSVWMSMLADGHAVTVGDDTA